MKRTTFFGLIAMVTLTIVACSLVGAVWYMEASLRPAAALKAVASWFDGQFVGYNLMVLLFAVLIPPLLAISYTSSMCEEKTRRMRRELGALWEPNKEWIGEYIDKQFRWRDYLMGVAAMSSVVAFGGIVLLLLKPINSADLAAGMPGPGLDFARGANLLLLGPYVEHYGSEKNFHMVVHSLTAFAFGFLGAYVYSIGQLIRGYFTVDLSPSTFVSSAVRIIAASCTALVAAFGLSLIFGEHEAAAAVGKAGVSVLGAVGNVTGFHPSQEQWVGLLPVIGFFFGYFPNRALKTIQHIANRVLGNAEGRGYGSTSLKKVSGMNINHAYRLEREGIDNLENLAASEPIEIALRTGFPYPQVKVWVEEARLRIHLSHHFIPFVERTGIRTHEQLCTFARRWDTANRGSVYTFLADTMRADAEMKKRIAAKLEAIVALRDTIDDTPDDASISSKAPPVIAPTIPIRRNSATSIQAS
jgi:hypothetical protein